jgi:hypothetical protein
MKRNGLTRESHDSQMIFSQKPLNRRFPEEEKNL